METGIAEENMRGAISHTAPTLTREPSHTGILILMILSSFILSADYSITGITFPSIGKQFSISASTLSLVVVADTLAIASLLIVGGRLVDRFGHRTVMVTGLSLYALGSIVACSAPNIAVLATARVLHGIATALVSPASFSLIVAFLPEDQRRRGLGLYATTQSVAILVGLFAGGWVTARAGWHMAYLMMLPLIGMSLYLAALMLPRHRHTVDDASLDIAGAATVTLAMVSIVSAFITMGTAGFTVSVALRFVTATVLLAVFVAIERRARMPLLSLTLLQRPDFAFCCGIILLLMGATAGQFVVTQLNLQNLLGFSPATAGLASLPAASAGILSGMIAPPLMKHLGSRKMLIGAALCLAAGLAFLGFTTGAPYHVSVLPASVLCSFASFVGFIAVVDIAISRLPAEEQGVGTGVLFTCYQVGIAALTSLSLGTLNEQNGQVIRSGYFKAYLVLGSAAALGAVLAMVMSRNRTRRPWPD
jgi:MFS family permease